MLESVKAFRRGDKDKLRLFEVMVVTFILLVTVGVMLTFFTALLRHSRELALKSTARTLYIAVLDYTASHRTPRPDAETEQHTEQITEQSAFLREYVDGAIKGKLTVHMDDNGYVQGIEYTEGGKTVTMPAEQITTTK